MRTVTAAWDTAIRNSHQMRTEADVLYNGTAVLTGLNIVDGGITYDRAASVLARCNLTLAEPTLLPGTTGDLLSPYGYEIAIRRGVVYGNSTVETVPLGVFPIQKSDTDGVTLLRTTTMFDRSQRIVDADFEDVYSVAAGTNYVTAIQSLILAGVPSTVFSAVSTTFTTPALTFAAFSGRWKAAQQMARSIGMEIFFDGYGTCVIRNEPDVRSTTPVWEISETVGATRGVLLGMKVSQTRDDVYNRVYVSAQNAGNTAQYRGFATDTDPASPTYYDGPFGRKPREFKSALIGSQAQADQAAAAILASQLGLANSLDLDSVPNPALEAGDVVRVRRSVFGMDEIHIADVMSIGLSASGVQHIQSRARQAA